MTVSFDMIKRLMFAILDNASHNVEYIRNCINTLNEYFNVIEGEKEE